MRRVLIFGGTTEGRKLAEFCDEKKIPADVSVATEYGREMLTELKTVRILSGRLTEAAMEELLKSGRYAFVLDATHPYAAEVTASVRQAGEAAGIPVHRVLRETAAEETERSPVIWTESAEQAAELLAGTTGAVLLATGSKELHKYGQIDRERLYVRVLPGEEPLRLCREAGVLSSHIAAMQGPFSEEMNTALLRHFHCAWMVTKESGKTGGFGEKVRAASAAGVRLLVIGRPAEETGISESEAEALLLKTVKGGKTAGNAEPAGRTGLTEGAEPKKGAATTENTCVETEYTGDGGEDSAAGKNHGLSVTVCGIGPGSAAEMTAEVKEAIRSADLLIGASRMVEAAQRLLRAAGLSEVEQFVSWEAEKIAARAEEAARAFAGGHAVILMSGDSGFYSGTAGVLKALKRRNGTAEELFRIRVLPGVSSLSCLAARAGLPWDQAVCLSLHGRRMNVVSELRRTGAVFVTLENTRQIDGIARALTAQGMWNCEVICGEDLSFETEKVIRMTAGAWAQKAEERKNGEAAAGTAAAEEKKYTLSAALILNPEGPQAPLNPGIPDECFTRRKVPLTKETVRAAVMQMLRPKRNSVCWDIGSGTGGMTAEFSMAAPEGTVFAVECDDEAFDLTKENAEKLGLLNVMQVKGKAPEVLLDLPAPDHVFVGGSSGNLREILGLVYEKNPAAVTAVTAVSLETAAALFPLLKEYEAAGFPADCRQVSAASARQLGNYHLMTAQNPVFIGVIRGKKETA